MRQCHTTEIVNIWQLQDPQDAEYENLDLELALRQKAAGAFSLPPFQVPYGPKMLWNLAILHSMPKSLS